MQPNQTKGEQALQNRVLDGAYQSNTNVLQDDEEEAKRGKETKRWATHFTVVRWVSKLKGFTEYIL